MSITNTPFKKLGDYTIDELSSVSIEQLSGVSFDRQFSPLTNTSRVSDEETWASNTTTWATETRTWADMASLMDNTSISTDYIWSNRTFPWTLSLPWQQTGGMTNINKP